MDSSDDEGDDEPLPPLCVDDESSDEEDETEIKNLTRMTTEELDEHARSIEARTGVKLAYLAPSKESSDPNRPPKKPAKTTTIMKTEGIKRDLQFRGIGSITLHNLRTTPPHQ